MVLFLIQQLPVFQNTQYLVSLCVFVYTQNSTHYKMVYIDQPKFLQFFFVLCFRLGFVGFFSPILFGLVVVVVLPFSCNQ